jgi:hypothetical protein
MTLLLLALCVLAMTALRSAARGSVTLRIGGWLVLASAWTLGLAVLGPERGLVEMLLLTGAGALLVVFANGARQMLRRSRRA